MSAALTQKRALHTIKSAAAKITRRYQPEKIILFGSFAAGYPSAESDADLLIIKQTEEKFIQRALSVRKLLNWEEDALISPLILTPDEISRRTKKGDQFIAEILQGGKILYEA